MRLVLVPGPLTQTVTYQTSTLTPDRRTTAHCTLKASGKTTHFPRRFAHAILPVAIFWFAAAALPAWTAAGEVPFWPASQDLPVADPSNYITASLAVSPDGDFYIAMSRLDSLGGIAVDVVHSLDSGASFEPYGSFGDTNPEHTFSAPSLVYLTDPDRLVLAMLEEIGGTGYAVLVARTLVGTTPDWQLVTVGMGQALIEPQIVVDPLEGERLYLIYRAFIVSGPASETLGIELDFARSTDGGASWSQPLAIGETVLPQEMTSASVIAGPDSLVHVGWVASGPASSAVFHRRHLQAGDSSASFEPSMMIVGPAAGVAGVRLAAGSGPEVLALYLSGDGTLRAAWSPDAGASFPLSGELVVASAEVPEEYDVIGEGEFAHLVYRAGGRRLRYRPLRLADPTEIGLPSSVSEEGEPAAGVDVAIRRDVGPGAVWFKREVLPQPYIDASWFMTLGIATEDAAGAGSTPAVVVKAVPNPFRSRTTIELQLAESAADARLAVVSPAGRVVALLHEGPLTSGLVRYMWDGRDVRGRPLPAGVYYVSATLPGGSAHTRAVLLR